MQHCKPIDTLIVKSEGLSRRMCLKTPQEKEYMMRVIYPSVIGSLMYVMIYTRLDICFAIGKVSWYQSNLRPVHWKVVKWIQGI